MRFRGFFRFLLTALTLLTAAAGAHAQDGQSAHIKAKLVTASAAVPGGADLWAAIDYTSAPGWHTYWVNPGDTGLAPKVTWDLPDGFSAGDIQFPIPKLLPTLGLVSYGYEGRTVLLVKLHNGGHFAAGQPLPLKAHIDFLVCADVCVPEGLEVAATIAAGPARDGDGKATIDKAMSALPKPLTVPATISVASGVAQLGFRLPGRADGAYFFPADTNVLKPAAAQALDLGAAGFTLRTETVKPDIAAKPISGILKLADGTAYAIQLAVAPLAPDVHGLGSAPAGSTDTSPLGIALAMGLAFVGGLILNLMPCVFPVLSMKLLSLTRAGHDTRLAQAEALLYGAGAILSFVALAVALDLAHRAGASLGWGFQLQSPFVVAALAIVMLLVALNMSGVFEIGASLQGVGSGQIDARRPLLGAFLTGVLAVVVAAPCTAPFMATAIGVALAQGGIANFAIFFALGLGFALPFVALTFAITLVPAVANALPRPGTWMNTLKLVLSLLMYAAALWLVWVFAQQVQVMGVAVLVIALIAVTMAVAPLKALPRPIKAGFLAVGVVLGFASAALPRATSSAAPATAVPSQAFHVATLAELRSQGKPVFVDLTAAWCVTCKVNERLVLSGKGFGDAVKSTGTVYMVGDWTNQDAEISHYLTLYGRSGVPLYVYYGAHNAEPKVLPQMLNSDAVVKLLTDGAK
ncbi:protein-disulfide reductase DsbD family protein [Asticcacaulis solisilvae]|uniref:protein-disulfide reductase DsbD family protein n=1 Tax=Asticcacaulis solisilvae TaxID=1217274 RepID=UPI003FD6CDC4